MEVLDVKKLCEKIKANISKVIVGKEDVIDLALVSLLSSGHVLLEDVRGRENNAGKMSCKIYRL